MVGIWLLAEKRESAYVQMCMFAWLFSAGLRRVVDWQTSFDDRNPVLLAASAVSLVGLAFCDFRKRSVGRSNLFLLSVVVLAFFYGSVVGVLVNGVLAASVALVGWLPPFALGIFFLFSRTSPSDLARDVARLSWIPLAILGSYGILQWFLAPPWDTAWMQAVSPIAFTFGEPEPFEIRVFSLLNSPYPLGCILVFLLVSQIGQKSSTYRWLASIVGIVSLLLSEVRAAWIIFTLVALLLWFSRQIPARLIVGFVALGAIAAVAAPSQLSETVSDRFSTVDSASSDVSFAARVSFFQVNVPILIRDVAGKGMGSVGSGVRASGPESDATFRDADSTYIATLRIFGPLVGIAFLVLYFGIALRSWMALRRSESVSGVWSSILLALPVLALLGDVFVGAVGIVAWLPLSVAIVETSEFEKAGEWDDGCTVRSTT